jgi:hypothetical protein
MPVKEAIRMYMIKETLVYSRDHGPNNQKHYWIYWDCSDEKHLTIAHALYINIENTCNNPAWRFPFNKVNGLPSRAGGRIGHSPLRTEVTKLAINTGKSRSWSIHLESIILVKEQIWPFSSGRWGRSKLFYGTAGVRPATLPSTVTRKQTLTATTPVHGYMTVLIVLPPFRNIRCFSFVKWVYLDIF